MFPVWFKDQKRMPAIAEHLLLHSEFLRSLHIVVELNGIEPMTSCLQSRRSPN
jgi:hypothetical protein